MKRIYTIFLVTVLGFLYFGVSLKAQVTGSFTDARDQNTYNYVVIGETYWMSDNLTFKADSGCFAYQNLDSNLENHGYLYTWEMANMVCPQGWHLPSDDEWKYLELTLGMDPELVDRKGFRESVELYEGLLAGGETNLDLSMSGWSIEDKKYYHISRRGAFWTSSINRDDEGWYRFIDNHKGIFRVYEKQIAGFSVRCVKGNSDVSAQIALAKEVAIEVEEKAPEKVQTTTKKAAVVKTNQATKVIPIPPVVAKPRDMTPPTVSIQSPQQTRGSVLEVSSKTIQITGKVADESGVFEVFVNRVEAIVASDGSFQATIPLAYGTNEVSIRVTDLNFNTKTETLTVVRKTGVIEQPIAVSVSSHPTIEWRKPTIEETDASSKDFSLNVCIRTKEKFLKISVFNNAKLIKNFNFEEIVFRGDCDFVIDEIIQLEQGANEITVSIVTDKSQYQEKRIVNYNFISASYYALIIGVEDYDDEDINDLTFPITDGKKLKEILVNEYTFEEENISFLKNPTKADIIGKLHKMRSYVTAEDNLLIFYAGHGIWDEGMNVGYWLPSDSEKGNPVNWFSNTDLTNYLSAIKSKHTLLIADACFSGGIFKTRKAFNKEQVIERLYQLPSRKAITSGTLKEVPDQSVFIEYLLKRLEENKKKYMSTEELFSSLRNAVMNNSDNIPQFGTIKNTGDEGGDFIFIRR